MATTQAAAAALARQAQEQLQRSASFTPDGHLQHQAGTAEPSAGGVSLAMPCSFESSLLSQVGLCKVMRTSSSDRSVELQLAWRSPCMCSLLAHVHETLGALSDAGYCAAQVTLS